MAGTKRRSTRQAATRRRSVYLDPETDDDFEADSDEDAYQPVDIIEVAQEPAPKKRKLSVRRKPQTRSKAAKTRQTSLKRVFKVGKVRKPNAEPVSKVFTGPSDGKIPKWAELPHNVLKQIFVYAAGDTQTWVRASHDNAAWLKLSAARVCRAFSEPALEAFYDSPGIHNTQHPHQLLELLQESNDRRYINYNAKVHSLNIDLRNLAYSAPGRPVFDLLQLIPQLPQLRHMQLLHQNYEKPYRPRKQPKWTTQPRELIKAMEDRDIHLRTWRWSRDTIAKNPLAQDVALDLYEKISNAHESSVFAYLTRLIVTGFNVDDSLEPSASQSNDHTVEGYSPPGLATSIAKLPALTDLSFISCDIIMEKFLQRLPTNLQRLELSNCLEITSDMLRDFFDTSGAYLKELELNNNAALNLSFTQSLKEKCPRLEVLKMDLQLYSERETTNDAIELYDELLPEDEIASWPTTLRHLEILEAQKWSPNSAQNFFRTLVDRADELLDLRTLIIHAHIDIPWRDRVGFRDQWIERLRRVYERPQEDPFGGIGSLKQFRMSRQKPSDHIKLYSSDLDELSRDMSHTDRPRRSRTATHVQISPHKPSGDTDRYSDSDSQSTSTTARPRRRSRRVAESQVVARSTTATPAPESASDIDTEDEDDTEDWRKIPEKYVQGLCNIVDVRIDNQRPRETQWREADFLDAEASGDDDWNEDAEEEEDGYAW
ncbi:Putative leucine-rich repeat domain superfamily [Septoria linicola]|uniref:Leucine-rich repeat domain superfamily n=1 Tax=Septoria linicola TaxID=215465 RepID=A0A9Q9ASV0_9PEZI|nr:Putative leucine-rich repeat domain superfamily [Septoria linicola]